MRVLLAVLLVAACGDDAPPIPTCASLGCADTLLCSSRRTCQCPTDAGVVTCTVEAPPDSAR